MTDLPQSGCAAHNDLFGSSVSSVITVELHRAVGRTLCRIGQYLQRTGAVIAIDALVFEHDRVFEGVECAGVDEGGDKAFGQEDVMIQFDEVEALQQFIQFCEGEAGGGVGEELCEAVLHRADVIAIHLTVVSDEDLVIPAVGLNNGVINLPVYCLNIVGEDIDDGVHREEYAALVKSGSVMAFQIGQLVSFLLDLLNRILPVVGTGNGIANTVNTVTGDQPVELRCDEAAVDVGIEHMAVCHYLTIEAAVFAEDAVVIVVQVHGEQFASLLVADLNGQLGALGDQGLMEAQGEESIGINSGLVELGGHVGTAGTRCSVMDIVLSHGEFPPSYRSESSFGR